MRDYPLEVKLEAVRLFLEEGEIRQAIFEQQGNNDDNQIDHWLVTG